MLQIIIFELAAIILAVSNLSVDPGSRVAGAVIAAVFIVWGVVQGSAMPIMP